MYPGGKSQSPCISSVRYYLALQNLGAQGTIVPQHVGVHCRTWASPSNSREAQNSAVGSCSWWLFRLLCTAVFISKVSYGNKVYATTSVHSNCNKIQSMVTSIRIVTLWRRGMKAGENSFSVDGGRQIPQHSKKSARGRGPGDGNQAEPISTSQPHRLCVRLQVTPAHSTTYGTRQGSLQQEHHELFSIQRMQTHRKPHLIWAVLFFHFFFFP